MAPKLGILAGGGSLPELIIRVCQDMGREFFVIAFKGQADNNAFLSVPHKWVRLGAAGQTIQTLRDAGINELVLAGTITRPSLTMLRPDAWTARFFIKTKAYALGDDGLLGALINTLENNEGFTIVGADDLLPSLLAKAGVYGQIQPGLEDKDNIQAGIRGAQDLGLHDIGQSVVAQSGHVLVREDIQGTDSLLRKSKNLKSDSSDGVLVKVKKPGQERRVDLPTIGPETVHAAARSGLRGIAIEAGGTLILDLDGVIKAANTHGLFVLGINVPPYTPLIYLSAGEPSGDLLGARLMQNLKIKTKNHISFAGVGGPHMEEQGLVSLFPMTDLSVMGLFEVIPKLPLIRRRLKETTEHAKKLNPSAVVTIDSPDFNCRIAKRLKGRGIPLIHYVAPSVWAWRPKRAARMAGLFDHLLTLLPFEPPFFEAEGLSSTFVGHSVLDGGADSGDGNAFRKRHGIDPKVKIIAVLPGSRKGEISHLGDTFEKTLDLLILKFPEIRIILPCVAALAGTIRTLIKNWKHPVIIVEGEKEKFDAFAAADVALAASGTVALELALARTPAIIAFKTNILTWILVRWLVKIRFAHLVNLLLDNEAIPEFIQGNCNADLMALTIESLLYDKDLRNQQIEAYDRALKQLNPVGGLPAERAAEKILSLINIDRK